MEVGRTKWNCSCPDHNGKGVRAVSLEAQTCSQMGSVLTAPRGAIKDITAALGEPIQPPSPLLILLITLYVRGDILIAVQWQIILVRGSRVADICFLRYCHLHCLLLIACNVWVHIAHESGFCAFKPLPGPILFLIVLIQFCNGDLERLQTFWFVVNDYHTAPHLPTLTVHSSNWKSYT